MRMYDIIHKKRDGIELTDAEIRFFVEGYTSGKIPDYQASALLMAIYFKGMTENETVTLTDAMAHSGDTVDLSCFGDMSVDKHSTGGVGDKTSIIIAPIVAALGGKVTKMSGRGLGHTGGTVDKLESISGFKTTLCGAEFLNQVKNIGVAVIGQSGNLTPADKMLYALRDVTATVESIPLITSSIMSKKIAAGSYNILLDVKVGSGAFMKTAGDAEKLATEMVKIGKSCGRNVAAVITDMNTPLGTNIGNALEIKEAVSVLRGDTKNDLYEVCVCLAAEMVSLVFGTEIDSVKDKVLDCIESGKALKKFREWIAAQGGNTDFIDNPDGFGKADFSLEVISYKEGYISQMNAEEIGNAAVVLGAGRAAKTDKIDYSAGIVLNKKTGDKVCKGDVICTLYTNREETLKTARDRLLSSLKIDESRAPSTSLIYKTIR